MLSRVASRASGSACLRLGIRQSLHRPALYNWQQKVICLETARFRTGNGGFEGYGQGLSQPRTSSFGDRRGDFGDRRGGSDDRRGGFSVRDQHAQPRGSNFGARDQQNGRRQTRSSIDAERAQVNDEIVDGTAEKREGAITKFADLGTSGKVSPVIIDTITRGMGLETMTPVQIQTIEETLSGIDVIAQARTGTGKTLAFLIPILQNVLTRDPTLSQPQRSRGRLYPDIRAVIISPTRELAEQIAAEAERLVKNTSVVVQIAVGGTQKRLGLNNIMTRGCHLLVGTPGRLQDIFSDPMVNLDLSKVNTFVLDEADRLLDQGFFPDIQAIASFFPPKENRQNMLFSATVPRDVLELAKQVLNNNSRFVQTIQKGDIQTHEKVPQNLVVMNGLENQLVALTELVLGHKERAPDVPFKAMVFLNTTNEARLHAEIFKHMRQDISRALGGNSRNFPIYEIHSKLTQAARTRTADMFRRAEQGILFTSDVSARGMDYPNVSHVIQLGLPRTRDYYIHRVGRTGRGEKSGEGWLLLAPFELPEAKKMLRNLRLNEVKSLKAAAADLQRESEQSPEVQNIIDTAKQAADASDPLMREDAFRGSIGYLSWLSDKDALVDGLTKLYQQGWAMPQPPRISPTLASVVGLRGRFGSGGRAPSRMPARDEPWDRRRDGQSSTSGYRQGGRNFAEDSRPRGQGAFRSAMGERSRGTFSRDRERV